MSLDRFTMVTVCVAAGILCGPAAAQHSGPYVFGGGIALRLGPYTDRHSGFGHFGAGYETSLGSRFTLGGEGGGVVTGGRAQTHNGALFSGGPGFHFLRRGQSKADPFVGGGVAVLAGRGSAGMYYYGGGLNYWFHRRMALRFEFRDHVWVIGGHHLSQPGARVGVAFR